MEKGLTTPLTEIEVAELVAIAGMPIRRLAYERDRLRETSVMLEKALNRRAEIEQALLDIANGKKPIPDKEQFRKWALKLGTPQPLR